MGKKSKIDNHIVKLSKKIEALRNEVSELKTIIETKEYYFHYSAMSPVMTTSFMTTAVPSVMSGLGS